MTHKLNIQIENFSDKDWECLVNDFYKLLATLEDIGASPPSPDGFLAMLCAFGNFYMHDRKRMIKCYNIFKEINILSKKDPT
jgi:hypothetical protein